MDFARRKEAEASASEIGNAGRGMLGPKILVSCSAENFSFRRELAAASSPLTVPEVVCVDIRRHCFNIVQSRAALIPTVGNGNQSEKIWLPL